MAMLEKSIIVSPCDAIRRRIAERPVGNNIFATLWHHKLFYQIVKKIATSSKIFEKFQKDSCVFVEDIVQYYLHICLRVEDSMKGRK